MSKNGRLIVGIAITIGSYAAGCIASYFIGKSNGKVEAYDKTVSLLDDIAKNFQNNIDEEKNFEEETVNE